MTESYPLQWPQGRPRTRYIYKSRFGNRTIEQVKNALLQEIRRLGGKNLIISTNLRLRQDGYPYSGQRQPDDKAAAVYFQYKQRQMCFACDRWDKIEDNIFAVAKTVEALRGIERWGSGSMVEQAFTGFVALPPQESPYEILGVPHGATEDEIQAAFKVKVKLHHPDIGGAPGAMEKLIEARNKLIGQ